jgi:hypothetical protein
MIETTTVNCYAGVVFIIIWAFFLGFLFLIRGPHFSNAQVFGFSFLLSAVTTLGYFVLKWAALREEKGRVQQKAKRAEGK